MSDTIEPKCTCPDHKSFGHEPECPWLKWAGKHKLSDTPLTDSDDRAYPLPEHCQHIQFEGSTCVVMAPEDYEELYKHARNLERQLTAANARNEKIEKALDSVTQSAKDSALNFRKAEVKIAGLNARVKELEARLQFDPGGGDKIDELESATGFLRQQCNDQQDWLDLMRDEFVRIKVLAGAESEIAGLCDRAIVQISQNVPLIRQLDFATKRLKEEEGKVAKLEDALNARENWSRTAKADAFEESAETVLNARMGVKNTHSRMIDDYLLAISKTIKSKAAAIRNGREEG